MSTAIEFDNISKQYRLGVVSTGTFNKDFQRWWTMNILRKEDPFLKIGETNDRSSKGMSDFVWALKDINFKVEQGDVVGIIGKNGAGKSTLLKLLSKVTGPTTGTIKARGRIGSLLEVGTGFHPEMTGRENIFLNGAILGMTKQEISRKLDEIVDFSGCERYIDTPVKRYSSGMMVRLGFAVAAHLDPEILVVDEVLAVGDAEFQKKAIGKMQDVSKGEGRTVLFVSHNMTSVRSLCKHGVVLKDGMVEFIGDTVSAISYYLQDNAIKSGASIVSNLKSLSNEIRIERVSVNGIENNAINLPLPERNLKITVEGELLNTIPIAIECLLFDSNYMLLAKFAPSLVDPNLSRTASGHFELEEQISLPNNITDGEYILQIDVTHPMRAYLATIPNAVKLNVTGYTTVTGNELNYRDNGFLLLQ